jgi:hypothetical protein
MTSEHPPVPPEGDELHHADGQHRTTPPTTNGTALARHEAALVRHLETHHAQAPNR